MTRILDPWLGAVPAGPVDCLTRARNVLVVSHENPDADTLGAAIGVREILTSRHIPTTLVCTDVPPPLYDFLPGIRGFQTDPDTAATYDLLVIVDCGSLERVGAVRDRHAELFGALTTMVIDHHASNGASGPYDWVDPEAAATCELVALLAGALGVPLASPDGALATALMAGIVMDTATFAHPNATPRTLAASAALVEAGAPLAEISRLLYRSKPDTQLRLFGRVLDRLQTSADGLIIHSTLTSSDIAEVGALSSHSEGIIDLLSQSEAAEVAILFKEAGPEATRVSIRTKPGGVDATVLTGLFGGGGHARAAGASLATDVAQARARVLPEAERLALTVHR
ncbi:MAG: bifunctional oligoribonuclease/PAP phosphatase NrnA [Chloroflexi bacterium]|nr:bifunctional oligoribonuclease/PAP phosphatase NrnA [Chloroflexota bacterium]